MQNAPVVRSSANQPLRAVTEMLLLTAALFSLAGCQGVSTGSTSAQVSKTGSTSAGQLSASPSSLGLGTVVAGLSSTASGNLSASGSNVTVTGVSSSNSAFSVGGLSLPVTVAPGQNVPFTVTFSPQAAGNFSANLTFSSNALTATTTEALSGTATTAPSHTVNLSWNASSSTGVTGYNVYRALYSTSCGSFSRVNSVLETSTAYSDGAVVDGKAYCYATTAVNSSNQESSYSNIVADVQIPAP